ncbi:hypothetical protein BDV12DRAFT_196335 [Aspergillus spectabilis]
MAQRLSEYTLAWICAPPLELAAATALDEIHPRLPSPSPAQCAYTLGKIEAHNVVLAYLPADGYGTTSATAIVSFLRSAFPNIRYALSCLSEVPPQTTDTAATPVPQHDEEQHNQKDDQVREEVNDYVVGETNSLEEDIAALMDQHTGILEQVTMLEATLFKGY